MPFPLPSSASTGSSATILRRDVVGLAQLGVDGNKVVAPGELQAVPGVVEERHVGVGRVDANSSMARCIAARPRSLLRVTLKPSDFSAAATSSASFGGLASAGTFL